MKILPAHCWGSACVALVVACGDSGDGSENPMVDGPVVRYELETSLCDSVLPRPNALFGGPDAVVCTAGLSAVDGAIQTLLASEGAPVTAEINVPVSGTLDATKLTGPVDTTSSAVAAGVPVLLLQKEDSAYKPVAFTAIYPGPQITLTPDAPLLRGTEYVVVVTTAATDTAGKRLIAPALVSALVSDDEITAATVPQWAVPHVGRLEGERKRLQPAVSFLRGRGIKSAQIASIHGWRTALGKKHLERALQAYDEAREEGLFAFEIQPTEGRVEREAMFPEGAPRGFYENIDFFWRGEIAVPALLDAEGHLRAAWSEDGETVPISFVAAIPKTNRSRFPVALLLPGYGRGDGDARALANAFGGGAQTAVLSINLRGHGDRSIDPRALDADLVDERSNGDPGHQGPDGIPDRSGVGFWNGMPDRQRDAEVASVIEVVHVLRALKDAKAFRDHELAFAGREGQTHLVAHGQAAAAAIRAAATEPVSTLQLLSGGIGAELLVQSGPAPVRRGFIDSMPEGVGEDELQTYLAALVAQGFADIGLADALMAVKDKYIDLPARPKRVLLANGSPASTGQHVPETARSALVEALGLSADRVSMHKPNCDDFFIYTCRLGDDFSRVLRAREQAAAFISSGGQTVRPPAP